MLMKLWKSIAVAAAVALAASAAHAQAPENSTDEIWLNRRSL